MDVLNIVRSTIKKYELAERNDRILIGLSGGADSVALLHILLALAPEYNWTVACAHVNHCLRPTAERDMLFCEALCERLGVKFFSKTVDVASGARLAGMSEELYARGIRYEYFGSLGYEKIATAHNRNDAAETLLFNFMRGASVRGLSGIPYARGNIIRPLLDIKKEDIIAFCKQNGYEFVTDETNFEEIYTRNKIRLGLIPRIEKEFNPNFVSVVTDNARLFAEDAEFLEKIAASEYKGYIDTDELNKKEKPIKRRILQLHWKKASGSSNNLPWAYTDDILALCEKNHTGKRVDLPHGFCAKTEYGRLIIQKRCEKAEFEYEIYPDRMLNIPETGQNIIIRKCTGKGDFYADADCCFKVRNRRAGDIFYPIGMTGKKRLSDFFTDKKIPSDRRDRIPIITCDGEIVSVGGIRSDRRFRDKFGTAYKIEIKEGTDAQK